MIQRQFSACLARPSDVPPSCDEMDVIGVFNPGAVQTDDGIVILARVAERPVEHRPGQIGLPRYEPGGKLVIDWFDDEAINGVDPRVVELKETGALRLTSVSHLALLHSADGRSIDSIAPTRFMPELIDETYGVEDPRLVRVGDTFYLTYVAVSPGGAATSLASTQDFETFTRRGVIFPPENKDVLLFPEKLDGMHMALHRPVGDMKFSPPSIYFATSPDLVYWGGHRRLIGGSGPWDSSRVGGGLPPVKTSLGWLEMYHGKARPTHVDEVGVYSAGLAVLDEHAPWTVTHKTRGPVMVPEQDYETHGFVPNVIFPTGVVKRDDLWQVFYGAADCNMGVVEYRERDLLDAVR